MSSMTATAAYLQVEIKGQSYGAELFTTEAGNRAVRLSKEDGTAYDVEQGDDRTTCNCPDWTRRHESLPYSDGCKHIRAVVKIGLIENVNPFDSQPQVEPEAEVTTSGAWAMPGEIESETLAAQAIAAAAPIQPAAKPEPTPVVVTSQPQVNLAEKYRPRTLADLVGQEAICYELRQFAAAPYPTAFLFDGDTGCGKTSAAWALANDLGCQIDEEACGGVYEIKSGNQTADDLRETIRNLGVRPMFGSGWKVLIVNECDRMSEAVAHLWLDALESLPARVVVVFSTNKPEKLPRRFVTRCERYTFASDAESLTLAAQARVNEVWYQETGRADAPRVDDLAGAVENGQLSIRACLQALNGHVRRAKAQDAAQHARKAADVPTVKPVAADATPVNWDAYGRRYAAGESRSKLAREAGVKETKFWNAMKARGFKSPKNYYHPPKAKVAS